MSFERRNLVLDAVKKVHLESWYMNLEDRDKIRLERYVSSSNTVSTYEFLMSIIHESLKDKNHEFTAFLCQNIGKLTEMSDYQRFEVNEIFIDSCAEIGRYDDLKAACEMNFNLFEKVKTKILEDNNGTYPLKLNFRNKYIDVIVGVDSNYDLGFEMLRKYKEMGLLDAEEFRFRCKSLNVHRLQRVFDGVYTYRPVGGP
ncbi:MAG: hypothetical protein MJY64_01140 [archaeon]|nr:hypothetical protein [archaeon]